MSEVRRVRRKRKKLRFGKVANRNLKITSWVIIGFLFILCIRIIYITVAYGDEYSIAVLTQQSFTTVSYTHLSRFTEGSYGTGCGFCTD